MEILKVDLQISFWCYILAAFLGSLFIRFFLCFFMTLEIPINDRGKIWKSKFWKKYWDNFKGTGRDDSGNYDHFKTLILGFLEISIFPILIIIQKPEYIGGWILLKTIPQWNAWVEKRWVYNRFLIGNALVIILSFFLAKYATGL